MLRTAHFRRASQSAHRRGNRLDPQRSGGRLKRSQKIASAAGRRIRIEDDGRTFDAGRDLFQETEQLAACASLTVCEAGNVAPRARQTSDELCGHRIADKIMKGSKRCLWPPTRSSNEDVTLLETAGRHDDRLRARARIRWTHGRSHPLTSRSDNTRCIISQSDRLSVFFYLIGNRIKNRFTGRAARARAASEEVAGPRRPPNRDLRTREHLTEAEVERVIKAVTGNRYGLRDATMVLVTYRH
jgi:hypothetical protein